MPFYTSPTPDARRIRAVHRAGAVMVSALAALALSGPASALAATDQATTSQLSAQHSVVATFPVGGTDQSSFDYGTPSADTSSTGTDYSDPNQADPNQADPNQADPNQANPNQADPNQADPNQADPNQADPNQAGTPLGTTVGRGECTDWALDRRPDLAGAVNGNAQAWTDEAKAAGRPISKTPSEGDLMVLQGGVMGAGGATGHVAYVESVQRDANGNPTSFTISEQNWNGSKASTSRTIPVSDLPANGAGVDFVG